MLKLIRQNAKIEVYDQATFMPAKTQGEGVDLPLLHKDPSGIRTSSISGNEELIDEQRPSERNHKTRKTTDKWIHP